MRAVLRVAVVGMMAGGGLLVSPGAIAAPVDAAVPVAAKAKAPAGFTPVRELQGAPLAGVSPSHGELWILEQLPYPDQRLVLEHLKSGRWTSEVLPDAGWSGAMAATARDDVWLAAGASLRHYDGRAWSTVALPTGPSGEALTVSALTTPSRGVLYASLGGIQAWDFNGHIFRYEGGAWTDLGAPAGGLWSFVPRKIVVNGDAVSVLSSGMRVEDSYDLVGGVWSHQRLGSWGGALGITVGGYYVSPTLQHLVLGGAGSYGLKPLCRQWTSDASVECTSTLVAGASAQLKNGSIVLGGNDYATPGGPGRPAGTVVQGTFALRAPNGTEKPLAGDPGSSTSLVVAEAHSNSAWAMTVDVDGAGPVYRLQRYDG